MKRKTEFDYVIVGSGAGGSTVASELSNQWNKKVLLIEAGPFIKNAHYGNFWKTVFWPGYYRKWAAYNRSKEGTIVYATRNVGGSTVFACGNMVRSLEQEFKSLGIDLSEEFLRAEDLLGIAPLPEKKLITGTKAIREASLRLGCNMVPMPKGMPRLDRCDFCGDCVLGCHRGAKWNAEWFVRYAMSGDNFDLWHGTVDKVLFDKGGHVRGVRARTNGFAYDISCGKVILCAGGLGTPAVLQRSRIDAGKGLFIDPFNVIYGIVDGLSQVKGMSMGAVLDRHKEDGFLLSPFMDHWSQFLLFCPWGWSIKNRFPRKRVLGIMNKITDDRSGRVKPSGRFSKKLTQSDWGKMEKGTILAMEILKEAGARDISYTNHPRGAHPGGTAAVGEVVDEHLKVYGTEGLYVCDASVFPKTPGLPPILTIVALGLWLSKRI